jgi:hypothetical protein
VKEERNTFGGRLLRGGKGKFFPSATTQKKNVYKKILNVLLMEFLECSALDPDVLFVVVKTFSS